MKRKPKGARGRAAVKRLGRNYATGGFEKIAKAVAEKSGSEEMGKKVAAAMYWKMVKKHRMMS